MTDKAADFVRHNDKSPVVQGEALGNGGEGGRYWLLDGKQYALTLQDVQALPEGYPKWWHPND